MGKIISGAFIGIILFYLTAVFTPNKLFIWVGFIVGFAIGTFPIFSNFFTRIIDYRLAQRHISKPKRLIAGFALAIICSLIAGVMFGGGGFVLAFPLMFFLGYSAFFSNKLLDFWHYSKAERAKNLAERDRLDTIRREERARFQGQLEAEKAMGLHRQREKNININIKGYRPRDDDGWSSIKTPREMQADYARSKRRADQHYKQTERDMHKKIWG